MKISRRNVDELKGQFQTELYDEQLCDLHVVGL